MVDKCAIIEQAVKYAYKGATYPPYTHLELTTILQDCPSVKNVISNIPSNTILPPIAKDDSATTPEGVAVKIFVLANDFDAYGNGNTLLQIASFTQGSGGAVTLNPDKTLTYTPSTNFYGPDSFTYYDVDGKGTRSNYAIVSVSVTSDRPVAVDDNASTDKRTASSPINVLANDQSSHLPLTVTLPSLNSANGGTLTLNSDNTVTYSPALNFSGQDTFLYFDTDAKGKTSNNATVRITVINVAPVAVADYAITLQNTPVNVPVLKNDNPVNPQIDILNPSIADAPSSGTALVISANKTITYTPPPNFTGNMTFTYFDTDQKGRISNNATVTVTVYSSTPTVPVAVPDSASVKENGVVLIPVLDNDIRTNQQNSLSVTISTPAGNGTASVNANNTVTYTPRAGFFGEDTFAYFDTEQTITTPSNIALVTVTVSRVLQPPVAVNDTAIVQQNSLIPISVLDNDSDPEDTTKLSLSIQIHTSPKNGTAQINQGSSTTLSKVTYTPLASFLGTDTFSYSCTDTKTGLVSNIANVTIAVQIAPPVGPNPPVTPPAGQKGNPYICGRPGSVTTFSTKEGGSIGAASWDFEKSITETYGSTLADQALIQFRWVKFTQGQAKCTSSSGCSGTDVCGTAFVPGVNPPQNIETGVCGPKLGYWSANQLCVLLSAGGAKYPPPPDNEFLKCSILPVYQCNGVAAHSCYTDGAIDNCCGCVNWGEAPYNLPVGSGVSTVNGAPFTTRCQYPSSNAIKPPTGTNSQKWIDNVLISDLWMKKACPSCYTYQFDDASSTFTCSSDYSGTNKANYLVVACPSTATNDPPAKATFPKPIEGTRGITFYNSCDFPIWPAMHGGTAKNRQSAIATPVVSCNSNADCFTGTECLQQGAGKVCFWYDPKPVVPGTQTPSGNFKADPGEQVEFRLPMVSDNFGQIWSGTLAIRVGCDETGARLCDIADCRAAPSTDFSCTRTQGFETPATQTEPTFLYAGADFYDIDLINGISIPMEIIPDVTTEQVI